MLTYKGIYDGNKIEPVERISTHKKYKVIITFIEEIKEVSNNKKLREFSSQMDSFDFWKSKKEDIYQDYLTRKGK